MSIPLPARIKIKNIDFQVEKILTIGANGSTDAIWLPFSYKGYNFPRFLEGSHQIETYLNMIDEDRMIDVQTINNELFYVIAKTNEYTFRAYNGIFGTYVYLPKGKLIRHAAWYYPNQYDQCIHFTETYYNSYKESIKSKNISQNDQ